MPTLDKKIVIFGQSCSGKTTFAQTMIGYTYYCFDALFSWHLIETLGLSISANYAYIREQCVADKYVLDGWHISDSRGLELPQDAQVYVVYAHYDQIIKQYRVTVDSHEQHRYMYLQWYHFVDYEALSAKYYFNDGADFHLKDYNHFKKTVQL